MGILCHQGAKLEINEGLSYLHINNLDGPTAEDELIDTFDISSTTLFITTDKIPDPGLTFERLKLKPSCIHSFGSVTSP